ncbi:MAG: vancomycin high temperature exclusion protein [Flavobacteriia bacterium]|nr:MAG: vancomycin high temperature exclusion protein [Flavobacteriia bacterium]
MSRKRKILGILILITISMISLIFYSNHIVESSSANKTYSNSAEIGKNKVGLVLGTAKYLKDGQINLFFKYRIDAAVDLFENGKIDYILISGDNGSKYYDEPTTFQNELINRGVPKDRIYLDYAGFRTLDSVVRAKEIFGQDSFTVISQKFHNERAIFLAEKHGLKAIGFNAKDVSGASGLRVQLREYLARTKAFIDIVIGKEPKFYGNKIEIGQ